MPSRLRQNSKFTNIESMELQDSLSLLFGEKVSFHRETLAGHGRDSGYPKEGLPLAVVYAQDTSDIQRALAWATQHQIAVIPYGAGTSLEGALVPVNPAISLDLSRMNRILAIEPENLLAVVEPGVTRSQLNQALRPKGVFFPVDPGADATLGGMAATGASGTTTIRYGGMRANVLALEVIMASGEKLRLGRPVRKTSSGYDLKDLVIGSEGTLAVISELTLKLWPLPGFIRTFRAFFPDLATAAQAAYALLASAAPLARLELLDSLSLKAINRAFQTSYLEKPALFIELHSATAAGAEAEAGLVSEVLQNAGATSIDLARTSEEQSKQWHARHNAYLALRLLYPGTVSMITDTAVPIAQMPGLIEYAATLLEKYSLEGDILGHVGDGNFHCTIAVSPERYSEAEGFAGELVNQALSLGGSTTGEHGVGLRKRGYLAQEHGGTIEVMRQVKKIFDPDGILNPGKVI